MFVFYVLNHTSAIVYAFTKSACHINIFEYCWAYAVTANIEALHF